MNKHAIFHQAKSQMSYALSSERAFVRMRVAREDMDSVELVYGDKYETHFFQSVAMQLEARTSLYDYFCAEVPVRNRRLAYFFRFKSGKESCSYSELGFGPYDAEAPQMWRGFFQIPYLHDSEILAPPDWVQDAVFYQIFPDRFKRGDNKASKRVFDPWLGPKESPERKTKTGGNLRGIISKLDYIKSLGCNALYLTPIFLAESNHKYDTWDYGKVDPDFGTAKDLKDLLAQAHKRGMRVILDGVFNHSGPRFKPFQDLVKKGKLSAYRDWYHVRRFPLEYEKLVELNSSKHWSNWYLDEGGRNILSYETFAHVPQMPKLNTSDPALRRNLLKTVARWTRYADLDGWRLDVGDEVEHDYWRAFRRAVKSEKPNAYIVSEIGHDALPWIQADQHDGVMNYPITWLCDALFARGAMEIEEFRDGVTALLMRYPGPANHSMLNLLESHDTLRFLNRAEGDSGRHFAALAFISCFCGAPMIYYGQEIGLDGGDDPDNRRCMPWEEKDWDLDWQEKLRKLFSLRQAEVCLRRGSFRWRLDIDKALAFCRKFDGQEILVLINPGAKKVSIGIEAEWRGSHELWLAGGKVAGGKVVAGKIGAKLELGPYGLAVLKR